MAIFHGGERGNKKSVRESKRRIGDNESEFSLASALEIELKVFYCISFCLSAHNLKFTTLDTMGKNCIRVLGLILNCTFDLIHSGGMHSLS